MRGDNLTVGPAAVLAHPRVRGDNAVLHRVECRQFGPPPRARGQQSCAAGPVRSGAVHPRVRGDNAVSAVLLSISFGPPPRARGRRMQN